MQRKDEAAARTRRKAMMIGAAATGVAAISLALTLGGPSMDAHGGANPAIGAAAEDARPAAAAIAAPAEPVEVALGVHGGRLVVPVTGPNGEEMRFVLTTGSTTTVLTESTARRLGSDATLTLGGISVPLGETQTIPDEALTVEGATFHGMVGGNVLSAYDVLLDVPGGRLVLKPVGASVSWPDVTLSAPQRLRIYHGVIVGLDIVLDGRPLQSMLDLGTPAVVVNEGARPEGMTADEGTTTLALDGVTLPALPLRVRDLAIFQRWDPDGHGFALVGAPLAWECVIALSWAHAELRTCVR